MMKKNPIVFTLLCSLLFGACSSSPEKEKAQVIQHVDAKKFSELISSGEGIILDVRTPEEVGQGLIKGALSIDFHDVDFEEKIKNLKKDGPVYTYCLAGGRSAKAADMLAKSGFHTVYNLEGGISAWKDQGYPIDKMDQ